MSRNLVRLFTVMAVLSATVSAATFRFDTFPFAGSNALVTPGRQVVGGEPSIVFDTATDIFSLAPEIFGTGDTVSFANDVVANLPASGANVIVLETFDNDNDPGTPFGAGNAANLIANQVTSSGPGFFIYFNSGLNLPRLVFSTDLSDNAADLKILARMTNFTGQSGDLVNFTASNFAFEPIPEPSSLLLVSSAGVLCACIYSRRRRRSLPHR